MNVPSVYPRAQEAATMADAVWLDEAARLPADPRASLDRVLRILWYRKWCFILVCAPILLAGLGSLLIIPEQYTAHGMLMVGFRQPELLTAEQARDPIRGDPDIDGATAFMRAYPALRHVVDELDLVALPEFRQSTPFLIRLRRLVAPLLRWRPVVPLVARTSLTSGEVAHADLVDAAASKLRNELKIERVGRSALLDISYSSPNPALAVDVVNAVARFSSQDESFLSQMTPAERAGFQIVKTSVVAEAVAASEPSSPNTNQILGITVFCALAAGFAAILLKELRAGQTVLSIEEVTRRNLRVLGLIPKDGTVERRRDAGVALVARDPAHAFSASVRSLQAAISTLPRSRLEGARTLLLTSALAAEGKSTTAAALATSMAASGDRVLLLDADLRCPTLHNCFGLRPAPRPGECADSQASPGPAIRQDPTTGVHFLAAEEANLRPLGTQRLAQLRSQLDLWRTQFDAILIDSPPLLTAGDARILAQLSDYVIVVVRWGLTSWGALDRALLILQESGARLAGIAVSRVDLRQISAYDFSDPRIYGLGQGTRVSVRRNGWGVDSAAGPSPVEVVPNRATRGTGVGAAKSGLAGFVWLLVAIAAARAEKADAGPLPFGEGVHVQAWQMEPGELESIKGAGFNFVRWGMGWEAIEKSPGVFDWTAADAIFENLKRVGLSSLVIIGGGNHLYSPSLELPRLPGVRETSVPAPPESDAAKMAWQRFAAAAAKRYADEPVTWEIWNEPDLSIFWPPQPDADADAQLVSMTCGAIKAVVPEATVVAPSTAAMPVRAPKFYTALARADIAGCLDGLSMHSYRIKDGQQPDPESVGPENQASRALLGRISARWRALPILCTEWGYPSSAVSPETQSAYLSRTYLANLTSGIGATVWYEWKDSRNEVLNPESHFGLETAQGVFKTTPNFELIKRLLHMRFLRRLQAEDPEVQALLFEEGNTDQVVAWVRSNDSSRTVGVSIGGKPVILGNSPTITPGDGIEPIVLTHAR
jgi:Mrp family chromosome partitioning ATPase/capsular polysaccharide biosynthesis protein